MRNCESNVEKPDYPYRESTQFLDRQVYWKKHIAKKEPKQILLLKSIIKIVASWKWGWHQKSCIWQFVDPNWTTLHSSAFRPPIIDSSSLPPAYLPTVPPRVASGISESPPGPDWPLPIMLCTFMLWLVDLGWHKTINGVVGKPSALGKIVVLGAMGDSISPLPTSEE